jgi:UDP-glucuronate 4-epimerase
MAKILITGAAGFIGFNLIQALKDKHELILLDALFAQQKAPLVRAQHINLPIHKLDLAQDEIQLPFVPEIVIHLAAETGISASQDAPARYVRQNILATANLLEYCKKNAIAKIIYASSSSVYAPLEGKMSEINSVLKPKSFYGFSKLQMEHLVHEFTQRYHLNAIGLRFFTVYGPWTRPDMAAYKFMRSIQNKEPITIYDREGEVARDFTFVEDICTAIALLIPKLDEYATGHAIYNIGSSSPVGVHSFFELISAEMQESTQVNFAPLPENELKLTYCDTARLEEAINYKASTSIADGVRQMVQWFKNQPYA